MYVDNNSQSEIERCQRDFREWIAATSQDLRYSNGFENSPLSFIRTCTVHR